MYRRLGGPQSRSGQVRKISPLTGIRSPNRPVRSQSLYLLSYPGPLYIHYDHTFQADVAIIPLITTACFELQSLYLLQLG